MKFHKSISNELSIILQRDLQQYRKEITMTTDEYKELCKWVQDDNSPYSNGWDIATDEGTPMDYISAKRIVESEIPTAAVYDTQNDTPVYIVQHEHDAANLAVPF